MTNTVVWIIVAVVVVLLLILVAALFARSARDRKHRAEADRIRDEVREQSTRVEKREAIATETDAKARAAAAEAEAKAAEAARLQDRASSHRHGAASSREHLDAELERADGIDPRLKTDAKRGDVEDDDRIKRDEVSRAETGEVERDATHRIIK
jgi:hypothetical protein